MKTSTRRFGRRRGTAGPCPWLLGIWACGALSPLFAYPGPAPSDEAEPSSFDEILVTARKSEEDLQDVPLSVQVLPTDLLGELKLTRLSELQFNVPGLVINNLGLNGVGFSLRGVADQGGSSLAVATHVNGVYLGSAILATARLFDLDRVEVLKGPQGTLYGQNSTGGSINVVTGSPDDRFGAGVEAAHGSFSTTRVQGHVNVPFARSALRLAFIASEGDGFIRNSVDDRRFAAEDFRGLRLSLLLNASEKLTADIIAQHVVDDGARGELWLPRPDHLADPSDIRLATVTLDDPFLKTSNDIISMKLDYDGAGIVIRSITGLARAELHNVDDCAGLPVLTGCIRSALPARHDQWSQELQLASQGAGAVDWLAGVYYYAEDSSVDYYQLTPVIAPTPTADRISVSDDTVGAVFGQASWHISESWSVTAGLRVHDEARSLSVAGTGSEDGPSPVFTSKDWHQASWRLDLEHAVSGSVLVYAGISTGFKSGGITILPGGVLDGFGPEDLRAYEIGIKTQGLAPGVTLNAAAFYYDFRDLQVSTSTVTDDGLIFETDNAARARIAGLDVDARIGLAGNLAASVGAVWLPQRKFVEYRNDRTGDTLSGNFLARAPQLTASAAIDYDYRLAKLGELSVRLEYNYRSDFFYTPANDPRFAQDGFGLLNLFLRFTPEGGDWYAFAAGRNLGDEDYFDQVFLQSSPGYPDTYEIGLGYRF